jgi:AcrR family transcriptional regulator
MDGVRPRERKSGAVRREEIAGAAVRIIAERGLTALSTSSLAAEVGVTTGALFRHFSSREEILRHATRNAAAVIEGTFPEPSLAPVERLMALARNRIRAFAGNPALAWFVRSDQAALVLPEDAATLLRDLVGRSKRCVLEAIRQGAREGTIRDDVEPEVLQVLFLATVHALVGMPGLHGHAAGPRSGHEKVLAGLRRLLAPPISLRTPLRHANPGDRG